MSAGSLGFGDQIPFDFEASGSLDNQLIVPKAGERPLSNPTSKSVSRMEVELTKDVFEHEDRGWLDPE